MTSRAWIHRGVWLAAGLGLGWLAADLSRTPRADAAGASSSFEDYVLANGRSNEVDLAWVLDYRHAALRCTGVLQNGRFIPPVDMDLQAQLEKDGGRKKGAPHFLMVAGRNSTNNTDDIVYVFETTTGTLFLVQAIISGPQQLRLHIANRINVRGAEGG